MVRAPAWILAAVALLGCGDAATKSGGDASEKEPPEAKAKAEPSPKAEAEPEPPPAKDDAWAIAAKQLLDEAKRARGLAGLKTLLEGEPSPRFGEVVVPVLVKIWSDTPKYHLPILELLRDAADPAAAPVWNRTLMAEAAEVERELALDGIAAARASASVDVVATQLGALLDDPSRDAGEEEGARRLRLVQVLGEVGDRAATPVLVRVLEQPVEDQPVAVHRAATTALGQLRDPAAVDAVLSISFRVPDVATTTNVGERAKQALASIGAPAVPAAVKMLQGKHAEIRKLAAMHGLDAKFEVMSAAGFLSVIGHPDAVEPLLAAMPVADCEGGPPDPDAAMTRAVIANALGLIGDLRAAAPLCKCAKVSGNPGDMFPIAGADAVACLADLIRTGEYDETAVMSADFVHQIRWEAARFGLLAADASQVKTIEAAVADAAKEKLVAEKLAEWKPGFDAAAECNDDLTCWKAKLGDASQPWIVREKAAFMVARVSLGDVDVALELAEAFSVRDPDARASMAWLTAAILGHGAKRCPACAAELQGTMDQEKVGLPATYQLSVLTARYTVAKLRE